MPRAATAAWPAQGWVGRELGTRAAIMRGEGELRQYARVGELTS
jgi:hypothetical protein